MSKNDKEQYIIVKIEVEYKRKWKNLKIIGLDTMLASEE